jgi:hypothetical protein
LNKREQQEMARAPKSSKGPTKLSGKAMTSLRPVNDKAPTELRDIKNKQKRQEVPPIYYFIYYFFNFTILKFFLSFFVGLSQAS